MMMKYLFLISCCFLLAASVPVHQEPSYHPSPDPSNDASQFTNQQQTPVFIMPSTLYSIDHQWVGPVSGVLEQNGYAYVFGYDAYGNSVVIRAYQVLNAHEEMAAVERYVAQFNAMNSMNGQMPNFNYPGNAAFYQQPEHTAVTAQPVPYTSNEYHDEIHYPENINHVDEHEVDHEGGTLPSYEESDKEETRSVSSDDQELLHEQVDQNDEQQEDFQMKQEQEKHDYIQFGTFDDALAEMTPDDNVAAIPVEGSLEESFDSYPEDVSYTPKKDSVTDVEGYVKSPLPAMTDDSDYYDNYPPLPEPQSELPPLNFVLAEKINENRRTAVHSSSVPVAPSVKEDSKMPLADSSAPELQMDTKKDPREQVNSIVSYPITSDDAYTSIESKPMPHVSNSNEPREKDVRALVRDAKRQRRLKKKEWSARKMELTLQKARVLREMKEKELELERIRMEASRVEEERDLEPEVMTQSEESEMISQHNTDEAFENNVSVDDSKLDEQVANEDQVVNEGDGESTDSSDDMIPANEQPNPEVKSQQVSKEESEENRLSRNYNRMVGNYIQSTFSPAQEYYEAIEHFCPGIDVQQYLDFLNNINLARHYVPSLIEAITTLQDINDKTEKLMSKYGNLMLKNPHPRDQKLLLKKRDKELNPMGLKIRDNLKKIPGWLDAWVKDIPAERESLRPMMQDKCRLPRDTDHIIELFNIGLSVAKRSRLIQIMLLH